MRVAQLGAVQVPLSITRRPTPEPGPGEILIKVTACGMCYSEVNLLNGEYPFARFPVVPGHEITGVVAALGPGVNWPAAGTPVGAQFLYSSCGHCAYCVRGDEILCPDKKITGVGVDGGYSEYFIGRAGFVTPLPDGLDPVAGAPLMCAGITAFNGLRQAGLGRRPGCCARRGRCRGHGGAVRGGHGSPRGHTRPVARRRGPGQGYRCRTVRGHE